MSSAIQDVLQASPLVTVVESADGQLYADGQPLGPEVTVDTAPSVLGAYFTGTRGVAHILVQVRRATGSATGYLVDTTGTAQPVSLDDVFAAETAIAVASTQVSHGLTVQPEAFSMATVPVPDAPAPRLGLPSALLSRRTALIAGGVVVLAGGTALIAPRLGHAGKTAVPAAPAGAFLAPSSTLALSTLTTKQKSVVHVPLTSLPDGAAPLDPYTSPGIAIAVAPNTTPAIRGSSLISINQGSTSVTVTDVDSAVAVTLDVGVPIDRVGIDGTDKATIAWVWTTTHQLIWWEVGSDAAPQRIDVPSDALVQSPGGTLLATWHGNVAAFVGTSLKVASVPAGVTAVGKTVDGGVIGVRSDGTCGVIGKTFTPLAVDPAHAAVRTVLPLGNARLCAVSHDGAVTVLAVDPAGATSSLGTAMNTATGGDATLRFTPGSTLAALGTVVYDATLTRDVVSESDVLWTAASSTVSFPRFGTRSGAAVQQTSATDQSNVPDGRQIPFVVTDKSAVTLMSQSDHWTALVTHQPLPTT